MDDGTIEVRVSFYGNLTRLAGGRTRTIRVEGSSPTVADLRAAIARDVPEVAPHLSRVAIGLGTEIFGDDALLRLDREISLLPPVSGGSSATGSSGEGMADPPRITDGPLSLDALLAETSGVDAGALVVFAGTVRAVDGGTVIAALDYDVHREMAERAIRSIELEICERPRVLTCRIAHRVGQVPAGEPSVYVVVRARHRPEAFEAARVGIDRVKAEAPIWKEDVHPDGRRTSHTGSDAQPLVPRTEEAAADLSSGRPVAGEGG
jgi:molybdopterin synthase catalytic subunit